VIFAAILAFYSQVIATDSDHASDEHDADLPNDNAIPPGIAPSPANNHTEVDQEM